MRERRRYREDLLAVLLREFAVTLAAGGVVEAFPENRDDFHGYFWTIVVLPNK